MISLFTRYFFIIFSIFNVYTKIINYKMERKKFILSLLYISFISYVVILLSTHDIFIKFTVIFLSCGFFLLHLKHIKLAIACPLLIISYALSFVFYTISSALISILYFILFKEPNSIPYTYAYIPTGLLQAILTFTSLNIVQFHSGILTIINKKIASTSIILSTVLVLYISIISSKPEYNLYGRMYIGILLLALSLLLLYYWRYRIKQTYIENMRRLEILSYENTIMDKDKQIKGLKQDNAELGQIIHKYRKVIPAMELSVTELLQNSSTLSAAELHDRASELQTQLAELRNERNNLLDKYQKDTIVTAQSGLHTVDAMIALMGKRAKQEGIRYKTQIDPTLKELTLNSVKESDLLHLLGDMVENAIHAVSLSDEKEILIHMGKLNDCLLLEISDSGIAFDIETYQHFGNEPFTSHKSDGGSGTGLMDMWKLKKTYKASLYIYEYSSEYGVYTKKISLLFDRKNHFLLKTYRDKEIKNSLIRGDLYVFPYQTD